MNDVRFACKDAPFSVISMTGRERLGEATTFELELSAPEPVDPASVLQQPASVVLVSRFGERVVHGVVTRFTVVATAHPDAARRFRATVQSTYALLALRRRTRVFQHLTVPKVIQQIFTDAGLRGERVALRLGASHAERAYVVQYAETDAAFVRRLCEEEGLYFRFEPAEGFDVLVLEDTSGNAPDAPDARLPVVDETRLDTATPAAFACTAIRRRRPGKVTLRDYDPKKPSLKLEGVAQGGLAPEKKIEVYRAPGRFKAPADGDARASVLLESLRAEAQIFELDTSAVSLAPGLAVELECAPDYPGTARPEGKLVVIEVRHAWSRATPRLSFRARLIPKDTPFRLPVVTPRPRISGIHSATVTGAAGEEIHVDGDGALKIRFPWDREGPHDDKSSLPVRVMQPNVPGSMLIPRVGWEVLVAFEDGDPDRPYVIGKSYNGKQPPPFALPANKTITALQTHSSPGAARHNSVHMDDAAGRQHLAWNAGFGKSTTVANNMVTQVFGFALTSVTGDQTWTIGGSETVSIKDAMVVKVGSQTGSVSAVQKLLIKAAGKTGVGSETVLIGGALLEQVGDPVAGAKAFAESAGLAVVGEIPGVGPFLSKAYSAQKAIREGYKHGGLKGAMMAVGQQAVSIGAEQLGGGGDALVAAADAMGATPWSDKAQKKAGGAEGGGGSGGPGGQGAAAAQAAPGHRKTIVDGVMAEAIGAAYTVTTPGSIKWSSVGASSFAIGGSHSTRAVKISRLTGGISSDTAASLDITTSKEIGRTITGALKTSIGGSLNSDVKGPHHVKVTGPLTLKVSGSLDADGGAVVFMVGSSIVAAHAGGVLLKASKVTINGKATQSGKATNK